MFIDKLYNHNLTLDNISINILKSEVFKETIFSFVLDKLTAMHRLQQFRIAVLPKNINKRSKYAFRILRFYMHKCVSSCSSRDVKYIYMLCRDA
jgi:hypothetical protein